MILTKKISVKMTISIFSSSQFCIFFEIYPFRAWTSHLKSYKTFVWAFPRKIFNFHELTGLDYFRKWAVIGHGFFFDNYSCTRKWISWKDEFGYSNTLVLELEPGKLKDYINVILMSKGYFEYFLEQVIPYIQWQNTKMWAATCNDTWANFISNGTGASHGMGATA